MKRQDNKKKNMPKGKTMKKAVMNNFIYMDADPCPIKMRQYYKFGEIKRVIREQRRKELRRK